MGWFSSVAIYFLMPLSSNVEDIEKKKSSITFLFTIYIWWCTAEVKFQAFL